MKKKMEKEMLEMIEKMESNKFLLQDSWSDEIELGLRFYKTYVGSRGFGRYINVEIYEDKDKALVIHFIGDRITLTYDISLKEPIAKAHAYLKEIFEQKFSFKVYSEEKQKLAREIIDLKKSIKDDKNKLSGMIQRYEESEAVETVSK